MSSVFQGLVNSGGQVRILRNTTPPAGSIPFRGMTVSPSQEVTCVEDSGQPRVFIGGIAFEEATGMLLISPGTGPFVTVPGGLAVDVNGAVLVDGLKAPDVIHQGIGMLNGGEMVGTDNWRNPSQEVITMVDWVSPGVQPGDWTPVIPGSQLTLVPIGSEPEGYVPGGGRCILLNKSDDSDRVMMGITLPSPVNLVDEACIIDAPVYYPGPFNSEDQGAACGVEIYVASGSIANRYSKAFYPAPPDPRQGWNTYSFPLQSLNGAIGMSKTGAPDPTAIDQMRLALENTGSTGAESRYAYVGPIRARRIARPKVMISFDDNVDSVYTTALPIMSARGLPGDIGVINSTVGNTGRMTWAQIAETVAQYGWAVMAHGYQHLNYRVVSEPEVLQDMADSVNDLRDRGYLVESFTWPGGAYTEYAKSVARDLKMKVCFDIGSDFVKPSLGVISGDYGQYVRVPAEDAGGTTAALALVDEAIRLGNSCFLYMHDIVSGPSGPNTTNVTEFTTLMDALVSRRDAGTIDIETSKSWISGLSGT